MREPAYQRLYMFFVGSVLLLALYLELAGLVYALAALVIFEAITNLRIVKLLVSLSRSRFGDVRHMNSPAVPRFSRFNLDAERAWQLSLGPILIITYALGNSLWFIPWFIALTVIGAGLSGVCPWLIALRAIGFK